MDIQLFEEAKRAQRGLMILKELKSNPHHIIGAYIITEDMAYTLVSEHHEKHGKTKAIRKTDRYTNGSFIIDEKDFGKVVKLYINSVDL